MLTVLLYSLALAAPPIAAPPAPKPYDVRQLAEGVYAFLWRDPVQSPIEGNALFIVNDRDVVVVDAGLLPSTARIMAGEVRKLTRKPVRYVINTHWHDDHTNGNMAYQDLWPGVEFIAHRDTRADLFEGTLNVRAQDLARLESDAERYARWVREGQDDEGTPLTAVRLARAKELAEVMQAMVPDFRSIRNTPPDLTFERELVLHRGERTIELRWLGRGNTRGDIVVLLPRERIAAIGDLVVWPIPFAFGSYYEEWITTLARLDSLPAEMLVPGHGPVHRDREYLHQVQGLLRALVDQVKTAVAEGASLEETQRRVTLPEWRAKFAGDDARLQAAFDRNFLAPAVERAWRQARGEPDGLKGVE